MLYQQTNAGKYCIGKVFTEGIDIAIGGGGNGKSTHYNLMARVLGDYAGHIATDVLTLNSKQNDKHELVDLRGKRLIIASELEEGTKLNTAMLKKLCSTDIVRGERKYENPVEFTPSHHVVLHTNHLPSVSTNDAGTWSRLTVLPFNAKIRGTDNMVLNYADYLFDHAGGAFLKWAVEGAKRYIELEYKIPIPEAVSEATGQYKRDNDWIQNFIDEVCVTNKDYTCTSGRLISAYRAWAMRSADNVKSSADFKAALNAAGYPSRKTKAGVYVYGLRIKEYTDENP